VLLRSTVAGVLLVLTAAGPHAATIATGNDCWKTGLGSTARLPAFSAGFFTASGGRTSQARAAETIDVTGAAPVTCPCAPAAQLQWVDPHGNPVQPGDAHAVRQTVVPSEIDTCVARTGSATWTTGGGSHNVPIEIVALSLRSASPITVTMNDLSQCQYNVGISLNGTQSAGSMAFAPSTQDPQTGALTLGTLPVGFQLSFTAVTGGCNAASQTGLSTTFADTNGLFRIGGEAPSISPWGMAVLIVTLLLGTTVMLWRRRRLDSAS
jgi:hypothetical protein